MKRSNSPIAWCAGLSVGILVALAIAPATGWLTRMQAAAILAVPNELSRTIHDLGVGHQDPARAAAYAEAQRRAAALAPDDFPVQAAAARSGLTAGSPGFSSDPGAPRVSQSDRIRTLANRFAQLPDYYATVTRMDTISGVRMTRPEGDQLNTNYTPPKANTRPGPTGPSQEQLTRFDADCAAGEKLDPDNAYFPTMRAIGLFEMKRDAEALAALHRAAGMTKWDDYVRDEVYGPIRLAHLSGGNQTALFKVAVSAAVLLPHFAQLRSLARLAIWKAVELELAGKRAEGLAIRRDILLLGSNLRSNSTTSIGSLVGTAIVHLAASRPGGAPALKRGSQGTEQQMAQQRDATFEDYARHNGDSALADWLPQESKVEAASRAIITSGINRSMFGVPALSQLMRGWIADLIAISNVFWLLLLSGAAAVYLRWRKAREEAGMLHDDRFVLTAAGGALALAMFVLVLRQTDVVTSYLKAAASFTEMFGSSNSSFYQDQRVIVAMAVAGVLAAPIVILFVSAIVAAVRRRPLLPGMAAGLRTAGPPLALLLVIAYGYLVVQTSRQEREISDGVDQTVQHEGRYLARLVHAEWPGVIPLADVRQLDAKQE